MKEQEKSATIPNWASWVENWCQDWHLDTDDTKKIEIGMVVVKFPDGSLHPGIVHPTTGVMVAGGFGFKADSQQNKKSLTVVPTGLSKYGGDVVPTEGEVYEEDDENP